MKVTIEIEGKPEEFQELFVPSEKQHEFLIKTYDAYVDALQKMMWKQVDPHDFLKQSNARDTE
jgi:lipoate-protein ligase A